jgi:hypothetical protein
MFPGPFLVAASNGGHSPYSEFPNYPRPQLPASHSNSSQRLNRSSPLTHALAGSFNSTDWLTDSELLYDWLFTTDRFVLAPTLWDSRPENAFLQLNRCRNSPYVTSSLTRRWVCLLWTCLAFRQMYVSHILHVIENSSFCTVHKASVSPGFAK